ncbi:tachykinin-like peptides receptor 86C [Aplysia californica]|uniref:Tachykinin-like peptides receptor 86C n=1 Tax=Aplysia californica TaxID=6500 RepID=A0ABM1A965_APLCA|nr:tachykinin-like peptides receptor 86C [Aplysia californica]
MASSNKSYPSNSETTLKGLVDDHVREIFVLLFFVFALGTISFFGVVFNAVNMIVFIKQGFKDTVNIALFGMAISDIGALLPLLWESVCFNPWFASADLPFDPQDVVYVTSGWPHVCFARITSWITAFVTLERCLCIAMPLKVKTIITPRRTIYVILGIYLAMFACVVPALYSVYLGPKLYPLRNETKIGLIFIPNGPYIETFSTMLYAFSQIASFFAVIVCTAILVQNLIRKSKWRESTSSTAQQESFSNRDKKIVKMILLIAVIFIVCFLPSTASFIAQTIKPEYNFVGRYQNLFLLSWAIFTSVAAVNSTVNIFVYYKMSSKYKEILDKMLRMNGEKSV